jgi:hypothetical protein
MIDSSPVAHKEVELCGVLAVVTLDCSVYVPRFVDTICICVTLCGRNRIGPGFKYFVSKMYN